MLSAKCPGPLADGKTPYERRIGEPFKGPTIPFGAMVEYHPISPRDQSRLHQFGKNSKIVRERLRIPRIHSKAATNRKERSSQWRTSR